MMHEQYRTIEKALETHYLPSLVGNGMDMPIWFGADKLSVEADADIGLSAFNTSPWLDYMGGSDA